MALGNYIAVLAAKTDLAPYVPSDSILAGALAVVVAMSFATWALSVVTRNYSIIDRIWSLLPPFYAWFFVFAGFLEAQTVSIIGSNMTFTSFLAGNTRLLIMAVLSSLWGIRLTYNYARKGGYALGAEDYRWVIVRKSLNNEFLYQILNFVFTAFIQNFLLFAIAFPCYFALRFPSPLNEVDSLAFALFIAALTLETAADNQQWHFYKLRDAYLSAADPLAAGRVLAAVPEKLASDVRRGFLSSRLFAYVRHPNFFAEVSLWWCFSLFAAAAAGGEDPISAVAAAPYPHSVLALAAMPTAAAAARGWLPFVGAAALTLLFCASTTLTEKITTRKYPAYKAYQAAVPRLLPLPIAEEPQWAGHQRKAE